MKQTKIHASLSLIVLAVALAGCGGGGDAEAGSPTAFGVVPNDLTLTARTPANNGPAAGQCEASYVGDVAIVGGVAPYRLINTDPGRVLLHRSLTDFTEVSTIQSRNDTFSVSVFSTCFDPSSVVVVDKLDHQVTLTLHNKPST